MSYPELKFLIGGQWRTAPPGQQVINPSDGSAIAELPHAGPTELEAAVAASSNRLVGACDPGRLALAEALEAVPALARRAFR